MYTVLYVYQYASNYVHVGMYVQEHDNTFAYIGFHNFNHGYNFFSTFLYIITKRYQQNVINYSNSSSTTCSFMMPILNVCSFLSASTLINNAFSATDCKYMQLSTCFQFRPVISNLTYLNLVAVQMYNTMVASAPKDSYF